jgi:hypothetical protein
MTEVYLALAAALGAFLTKAVEWIFNRKKDSTEVEGKEIDNDIKMADYYKVMLDDLQSRYEKKFHEYVSLSESKEKILRDEIALMNRQLKMLRAENMELRKRIKVLEAR